MSSQIQWTDETWNPTVGCTRVSAGCDHCYAFALHDRRHDAWKSGRWPDAPAQYHEPFSEVQLLPERLTLPLRWRKPRRVFVDSMADLFHTDVPDEFLADVFAIMTATPHHTYQVLTKRPRRMQRLLHDGAFVHLIEDAILIRWGVRAVVPWPLPNVWLGVSVEDQAAAQRIGPLIQTPAAVRFLSCEPLIGPVSIDDWLWLVGPSTAGPWKDALGRHRGGGGAGGQMVSRTPANDLHWVIAGGESGPGARPCDLDWLRLLRDECAEAGVPVFVKQLGSVWAKANSADPHGGNPDRWPEDLRVRQFPEDRAS